MNRAEVERKIILLALTGSHSYGLATDTSDKDYKGIFIAPKEYYLGTKTIEQKQDGWSSEEGSGKYPLLDNNKDTVIYELRKYVKLAAQCNPNILELLYEDEMFYVDKNYWGNKLIENRDLFLSKKVKHSYSG